jgi:hypothetical protein
MTVDDLAARIEETRITYPETKHGFTIDGQPFSCEFPEPVDPEAFCDDVTTAEKPWQMFGIDRQIGADYWKVVGTLFHVEDDEVVDASKIAFEVAPEWVRVYVKEDCSAARAADFVRALQDEYDVTVEFAGNQDA